MPRYSSPKARIRQIYWNKGELVVLDQKLLPHREFYLKIRTVDDLCKSIKSMALRGAPLIGIAAAYGAALAVRQARSRRELDNLLEKIHQTRPTAVNLSWAIDRIRSRFADSFDKKQLFKIALDEAMRIHEEDKKLCDRIGRFGAGLVPRRAGILTICNTGCLATGGSGTALSVIKNASSKKPTVYALETRPRLQGARLTIWEAYKARLNAYLICDSSTAQLMAKGKISLVITGADRIALNGDTANKIGTFMLAVLAKEHKIPFYVAAPYSTFDPAIKEGSQIPIEDRSADEVLRPIGLSDLSFPVKVLNPAFDVTPARYITAFITDRGILRRPFKKSIKTLF